MTVQLLLGILYASVSVICVFLFLCRPVLDNKVLMSKPTKWLVLVLSGTKLILNQRRTQFLRLPVFYHRTLRSLRPIYFSSTVRFRKYTQCPEMDSEVWKTVHRESTCHWTRRTLVYSETNICSHCFTALSSLVLLTSKCVIIVIAIGFFLAVKCFTHFSANSL